MCTLSYSYDIVLCLLWHNLGACCCYTVQQYSVTTPWWASHEETLRLPKRLQNSKKCRDTKRCPVCAEQVVHLPRHLRGKHKWAVEKARAAVVLYNLRKPHTTLKKKTKPPKYRYYRQYRQCPITSCSSLVKRVVPDKRPLNGCCCCCTMWGQVR